VPAFYIHFSHGVTTPSGPGTHYRDFAITLRPPHSVGPLWTSDQPDTQTSTWQDTALTTDSHPCLGGILTRNPNKQVASDPRHRRSASGIGCMQLHYGENGVYCRKWSVLAGKHEVELKTFSAIMYWVVMHWCSSV
jgi:hypothetical protein